MSDPDATWQTLLYSTAAAAVAPTPVEAHPPVGAALPFVRIGETMIQDHVLGHEIRADVHTFSRTEGPHEAKSAMHKIREAFHGIDFAASGWKYTCCREEDTRVYFDAEDEAWHGVQTFRVLASKAS